MGTLTIIGVAVAILLGALGIYRKSAVRKVARFVLGIFFALAALATLGLLYGSFALTREGGGVLLFLAIPAGIVAWVAGSMFFASVEQESYYAKTVDEKIGHNIAQLDAGEAQLRESIARKTAERGRFWLSAKRRERLDRDIAHEQWLLEKLPALRPPLLRPETYKDDESREPVK